MPLPARKRIQMTRFHTMIQLERLALRGNQVIPAAGDVQIRRKTEYAVSNGVAAMVVTKEPRINLALAQRGLNRGQIHYTIVLDCPHASSPLGRHSSRLGATPLRSRSELVTFPDGAPHLPQLADVGHGQQRRGIGQVSWNAGSSQ